jgi:hypothetical protein
MSSFLDGLFYWSGLLFWVVIGAFWVGALGHTAVLAVRRKRAGAGGWYGSPEQERALRDARDDARRVLAGHAGPQNDR